jgi:nitrogen fixation/metabolism regulation signal transduction histidine kinase
MKVDNEINSVAGILTEQESIISNALFGKLFPFHMLLNEHDIIFSAGKSLLKIMPDIIDKNIKQIFSVLLPHNLEFNIDKILNKYSNIDFLILKDKSSDLQLRVGLEQIPDQNIIAVIGNPWVNSIEKLHELNIELSDFSKHDSTGDMLMTLQLQKQTYSDMEEFGALLKKKKTELEETVKLLNQSEQSLHTLINSAGLGIIMTDLNGEANIWNDGLLDMIRIDREAGQNITDFQKSLQLDQIYTEQNLINGNKYEKIFEISKPVTNDNDNDYDYDIIKLTIYPIRDSSNNVTNYCQIFRDITDEVKLESILRENSKSKAVSLLTGQIAHQINNLLGGILANVDDACDVIEKGSVEIKDQLNTIDVLSTEISEITTAMLAFSGQQYLTTDLFEVNDKIRGMLSQKNFMASVASLVTLDLCLEPLMMKGDKKAFSQCISNILINCGEALEFKTAPNISLSSYIPSAQELEKENIQGQNYLCIRIKDNGIGIRNDDLISIFTPFYTTKGLKHQGMGLSFVQGYIRQIGGHLRFNSKHRVGTTIYIYIPTDKLF